jgi:hypothetical protein
VNTGHVCFYGDMFSKKKKKGKKSKQMGENWNIDNA